MYCNLVLNLLNYLCSYEYFYLKINETNSISVRHVVQTHTHTPKPKTQVIKKKSGFDNKCKLVGNCQNCSEMVVVIGCYFTKGKDMRE